MRGCHCFSTSCDRVSRHGSAAERQYAASGRHKLFGRRATTRRKRPAASPGAQPDMLQMALDSRGLTREQYMAGMEELLMLLPSLRPRFARLAPHLLVSLAEDPASVAGKLAALKQLFPTADVYRIVNRRPSLLLDIEFDHIKKAAEKLDRVFPDTDIGHMVEQQPLLLVEDIDVAITELQRLLGRPDVVDMLKRDPGLITAVVSNRSLSIW